MLENVSFEINDPCQTKIDSDIQQSLIEILGKHFLKILFNPGKKYKSIQFVDKHIHMDDTIINVKKKISHTLQIPETKLNIWCNSEQDFTNISKKNLFNILSDYNTKDVSVESIKDFIQSVNYIKRSDIDLDCGEIVTYHQWMKEQNILIS